MRIKSIAPYYGAKRKMAKKIIELLGRHTMYFEPFGGSLAVLMAKEKSKFETVCDLYGDVINLAAVLAHPETAQDLFSRMSTTMFSEELLDRAQHALMHLYDEWNGEPNVRRAHQFMIDSWQARNGFVGCERTSINLAVRWTKGGGSPTTRWAGVIDSIPSWCKRLQNVVILHRDAFEWLPKVDDKPDTAIYADPPYPLSTRGRGGGNRYIYDFNEGSTELFNTGCDHERLADILNGFNRARIVVSTYQNDLYDTLYSGWTREEVFMVKGMASQNRRGMKNENAKEAPEVLYYRGGE